MSRYGDKPNVLFISQEIVPFVPESEISITSRQLIQFIYECGMDIRTFMPRYGSINERKYNLHEVIRLSGVNIIINESDHPLYIKVASIPTSRMQVYFADNEEFFHRKTILRDENGTFFNDNDERMIFFCRSVIETVKNLKWEPDIIHCHGWLTSLIPLLVRKAYSHEPQFANTKIIYSVYGSDEFTNPLNKNFYQKVKMDGIEDKDLKRLISPTFANITKEAINWSDALIIGSEKLNREVQKHISAANKPVLDYPGADGFIDAYYTFYNEVFEGEAVPG